MSGGRIVLSGTADELRASESLLDSYLGQSDVDAGAS
jgi:ABC-type branched-subunit amino acid transport system ATPase component